MDFISYIAVPTDCVTAIDSSLDTIRIVANTHIHPRLFQRAVDDGLIYLFFVYLLQDRPLTAESLGFRPTARLLYGGGVGNRTESGFHLKLRCP